MRKYFQNAFFILLFALNISVQGPVIAFAQSGLSLNVSPLIIEMKLNPGETAKEKIKITTNIANSGLSVSTDIKDFYYNDKDQLKFMTPAELEDSELQKFSLKNWVDVESVISLEKEQSKEVEFTVNVPKDASPGGHYGMIFFGRSAGGTSGTGIGVGGKVGVMLLVSVSGEYSKDGGVSEALIAGRLSEDKKVFVPQGVFAWGEIFKNGPVDFSFKYKNNSATHFLPEGEVIVRNMFGELVDKFAIEQKRVFPGSSRSIYAHLEKDFLFGWYSAELNLKDAAGKPLFSKTSFIGFPLKLILIVCGVIGLIGVFFRFYNKWLIKAALKQYDGAKKSKKD